VPIIGLRAFPGCPTRVSCSDKRLRFFSIKYLQEDGVSLAKQIAMSY